ncbi:thiamine pyrophosphate-binding protein [Actinomadura terrae]|uniref:thiamine pyrophosphate-binding protein n=1 Tax=Actinomadura terrae TaxID=604353 RepID=UPI001FA79559|nr:thiamine pyrophosphate-binding protein [Actinomadura terrae]
MTQDRTTAHLLLDMLAEAGVSRIFGVPGGPLLSLLNVVDERTGIDFVLTKHEEGAVFMAEGHAQATGGLGVACVTAGPGTMHAITAAASATSDWAPLLVLGAQVPTATFGQGGLQDGSGGNWSIDSVAMFRSAVKLSALVTDPRQLAHHVLRAIRTATSDLPGAVYLGLPGDVLSAPEPPEGRRRALPAVPARRADRAQIEALSEAIATARNPVIFAGQGAKVSGAGPQLVTLAERRGIPVATTTKGKSVFPEEHPLSLGVFGTYGGSPETHGAVLSEDVDLLLVLGSSLGEVSTFGWDERLTAGRTICQVDADPLQIGRNFPVDHAVVADVRSALDDVLALLAPLDAPCPRVPVRSAATDRSDVLQKGHPVLRASALTARLNSTLPRDALIFIDNGNSLCWIGEQYVSRPPGEIFCSINLACMGYAIPASIGAKMARPERPVVAVVGDAAFAMTGMEIHTAVEQHLDVIWIVLNNGGNAMVTNLQEVIFSNAPGSSYSRPLDAAAIARGLGAEAATATTLPQFDQALSTALDHGAPWLIDARVDRDEIPWSLRGRAEVLRAEDG